MFHETWPPGLVSKQLGILLFAPPPSLRIVYVTGDNRPGTNESSLGLAAYYFSISAVRHAEGVDSGYEFKVN